jgi:hypothetical protein
MDNLNDIKLSSLIVGEWYKDALLASPDAPQAIEPSEAIGSPTPAALPVTRPIAPLGPTPPAVPIATAPAPPATSVATTDARPPKAPAPTPKAPEPPAPGPYKFLGNNRKQIAIIVHSPGTPFLPDNQLSFLTKILEACRMNIGDIAIVNAATTSVVITELRQQLNPTAVLLFGLEPVAIKLPINFPVFRLQPYDACTYLSAPALSQLVQNSEESKLLKSKLWVCLKSLFNV